MYRPIEPTRANSKRTEGIEKRRESVARGGRGSDTRTSCVARGGRGSDPRTSCVARGGRGSDPRTACVARGGCGNDTRRGLLAAGLGLVVPLLSLASPALAQPDQAYPTVMWSDRQSKHPTAQVDDEAVDLAYWHQLDATCNQTVGHWVYVAGYVTEVENGVPVGTRFAIYKYDATFIETPQNQIQPDEFAYYPDPDDPSLPLVVGDTYKAVALAVDQSNGSVFVVGEGPQLPGTTGTDRDYHLVAFDSFLNRLWTQKYDGPTANDHDIPVDVALTGNSCGGSAQYVVVTGTSPGNATGLDITTVAYTTGGDLATAEWPDDVGQPEPGVRRYNYAKENGDDRAVELARVSVAAETNSPLPPSLSAIVTGTSWGGSTFDDIVTIGWIGNDAQLAWVQRYHHYRDDVSTGIAQIDASGDVYVVGYSEMPPPAGFGPGGGGADTDIDITTLAYLADGNPRWVAQHDFFDDTDVPTDIQVSEGGSPQAFIHVWIGGWTYNPSTSLVELAAVLYTEPVGLAPTPTWSRNLALFGGNPQYAVRLTPREGDAMCLTGAWVLDPRDAILTLKYANPPLPSGPSWYRTFTEGGFDEGRAIHNVRVDGPNGVWSIFVTGTSSKSASGRDIVTIRYRE